MTLFLIPSVIYVLIVVLFYYLNKKKSYFQTKTSWWKNGFSLFAVNFSITTPLVYSGIIHTEGVSGLWLFWCAYAISGFLPFVFAPLWAKLNFVTDNQFLLFRYSGKGANFLHIFRTVYVGWIIVAFLMSFQLLALLKVISFTTGWDRNATLIAIAILLIVLCFKNRLAINIKLDFFHTIFIAATFIIILVFLLFAPSLHNTTKTIHLSPLFPENKLNLWVLFLVQTWSVNLFDGSGVEAQRFFATKNKNNVWKVAILSSALSLLFSIIYVLINYIGSIKFNTPDITDKEMFVLSYLHQGIPEWFSPFLLIAFFAAFITSFEGLLNWGASYLSVDGYKTYINKNPTKKRFSTITIMSMLLIVFTSITITYFNDNLAGLIKIFFSISAGVAPVFVLRWFWLRINAWSQLSAMLSSGVYTLIYQYHIKNSYTEELLKSLSTLSSYSIQLITITLLTSSTWVLVTFLTPKDEKKTILDFKSIILKDFILKKSILKALIFGIIMLLVLISLLKIIQYVW